MALCASTGRHGLDFGDTGLVSEGRAHDKGIWSEGEVSEVLERLSSAAVLEHGNSVVQIAASIGI